jgi:hypothetical protein
VNESGPLAATSVDYIPRQQLVYLRLDLHAIPKAHWQNVIQQGIRKHSPFESCSHTVYVSEQHAQIWLWAQGEAKTASQRIPEPLLHPPIRDGLLLQTCHQGYDVQYWKDSVLRASLWCAEAPTEETKSSFARACGIAAADSDWHSQALLWLPAPWTVKPFWTLETLTSEPILTRIVAGLLLAAILFQLAVVGGVYIQRNNIASEISEREAAVAELITVRDQATQQQQRNAQLFDLMSVPSQLLLSAEIHTRLREIPFEILDWQYQAGRLRLLVQQENLSTRAVIEALNASRLFTDVRIEPGLLPEQSVFSMTLAKRSKP